VARRAATVLTHKSEQDREEADDFTATRRPRRWLTVSIAAAIVALLGIGLWLGYAWTQTRYYIGEHDQHVAIFNGVSQRLGPIQLSTLEAVTDIKMSDLPEFSQQRVRQTVPARDLYDAQRIVKNLERTGTTAPADECLTPSPTATATGATPGATAKPSATASAGTAKPTATASAGAAKPGATARPSAPASAGTAKPSPSATPTTNCEGDK
jgi:protein phosphatase